MLHWHWLLWLIPGDTSSCCLIPSPAMREGQLCAAGSQVLVWVLGIQAREIWTQVQFHEGVPYKMHFKTIITLIKKLVGYIFKWPLKNSFFWGGGQPEEWKSFWTSHMTPSASTMQPQSLEKKITTYSHGTSVTWKVVAIWEHLDSPPPKVNSHTGKR